MELRITRELAALRRLSPRELRARYAEVFGETTAANNRDWLVKRIAWRLQALAEGDLSERARRRAAELANDADLRTTPPRDRRALETAPEQPPARVLKFQPDHRLPPPGTVITRIYKGDTLQVKVLADGFEYDGRAFPSLSAVAKHITGGHCNGYLFFRMGQKGGQR
jgi:hypothetical protein